MDIYNNIIETYTNNKVINKISINPGNIIQKDIFNCKLNIKNCENNKNNIDYLIDLIPLINVLFNKFKPVIMYYDSLVIYNENKILNVKQRNEKTDKIKSYYQNKLIDYQIEQISNNDSNSNIANNMLVKYKKIDVLPILEFNNLQNFNNIEKFKLLIWNFNNNTCLQIKVYSSYFIIELEINLNKTQLTQIDKNNLKEIICSFKNLLDYLNISIEK